MSKKTWTQSIINYYNVESLENFKLENNISDRYYEYDYVLLMDRVESFSGSDSAISFYKRLIQYKDNYYSNIVNDISFNSSLTDFLFNQSCKWWGDTTEIKNKIIEYRPYMINLVKELKKYHIRMTDFHSGNIGWCMTGEKRIVLFDIGGISGYNQEERQQRLSRIKEFKWNEKELKKYEPHEIR